MSISYDDVGDVRRIAILGQFDTMAADSVAPKLAELAAEPRKGVVVDLSSLRYLASIGISALIAAAKTVQKRGGKMVLIVKPGSAVAMSIGATGVDQIIPVFERPAEAEKAAVA